MEKRPRQFLIRVVFVILVFVLQLGAAHWTWDYTRQIESLEFGVRTATLASITVILGIASGVALASVFLMQQKYDAKMGKKNILSVAILLGIIPLLAIILKVSLGAFGPGALPFLRPVWSDIYEWVIHSQVPSFWLGLVIGWLGRVDTPSS